MMITWQANELPAEPSGLGHGVCILIRSMEAGGPEPVVAFVEGFNWLHRGIDAVVRYDDRRFPTGPDGDSLRHAVEELVRTGRRRPDGKILPGFLTCVNG